MEEIERSEENIEVWFDLDTYTPRSPGWILVKGRKPKGIKSVESVPYFELVKLADKGLIWWEVRVPERLWPDTRVCTVTEAFTGSTCVSWMYLSLE